MLAALLLSNCGEKKSEPKVFAKLSAQEIEALKQKVQALPNEPVTDDEKAVIKTTMGTIELEFFAEKAPNHCANFKKLANAGFYDGTTFHRVVPGFVIQGGDILTRDDNPANDGTGDAGYKLNAEFNDIHHDRGIISTARGRDINSAGTQFFICVSPKYHLDGQYTVFARVTKGMDIVDKIVGVERDSHDRPKVDVVMEEVRVVKK
ncbi:peptidylprolyl isomerase [candidate division KSB1 bacterium]|nr:peptidylprolyl isomerase [candidate division KSB1 bacterium]